MELQKLKNVLYIGNYDENYARNVIFLKGLNRYGIKVYKFNVKSYNLLENLKLSLKLLKELANINYDLILMYSPSIIQLIIAKFLSKRNKVPLVHDIFISKFQTFYSDRKLYQKNKMPKSFYKIFLYLLDLIECRLADYIILDTYSHIKFFHEKYNIPLRKFRRVLVGAQDDIFYPLEKKSKHKDTFNIAFWGTYIPLHGINFIIKAAKILEKYSDIQFTLFGKGQTYKESIALAKELNIKNISFIPKNFLELNIADKLSEVLSEFDIGLGIFGDTEKAKQVIPNKIFEGIAIKLPMLTADTPGINELFKDNENIVLCKLADPESLAEAILRLKNNTELREKIKENALILFQKKCSIEAIGYSLIKTLKEFL